MWRSISVGIDYLIVSKLKLVTNLKFNKLKVMYLSVSNLNIPPPLGHFFCRLTGQDRFKTIYYISTSWPFSYSNKGISYLHWKASLSFYGPFLVSHSVKNTMSCLVNRLTFSLCSLCTNGQIPHLLRLGVKLRTPAAVLKSNSLLPGKGRVSNARGMPLGGGGGGRDVEFTNW